VNEVFDFPHLGSEAAAFLGSLRLKALNSVRIVNESDLASININA